MLHEHKVFTTDQIVELCYPTMRAANHRLLNLYRWRVVDRFQPFVTSGTAPMHYVLDVAGASALAYENGVDSKDLGYRHDDAIGIAHSLRLAHSVGVNGFFTNLVASSRQPDARGRLTKWWSELRCGRLFGDTVRPDAYGRWYEDGADAEFFLEFDFGTEDLSKLASKLYGYHKLAADTNVVTPVVVWLTSSRRETTARRALADVVTQLDRPELVPVATSAADLLGDSGENGPSAARWLPVAGTSPQRVDRLRLAELTRCWPPVKAPTPRRPTARAPTQQAPRTELGAPNPLPPLPPTSRFRSGGRP